MSLDPNLAKIIKKCQADPEFFISNFCKVKHPTAGILPFKLFKYQKRCLKDFLKYRFNAFHKTRQSGISTLTGAFCLWYAMFFGYKTILIVSKTERDTLEFLDKNVRFVFDNLPEWMRELWKITEESQHKLGFSNGSSIKSLTSGKDVLRSNSSSLNIIDESAFMPDMSTMWSGGWPTLQHGGCLNGDSLIQTDGGLVKIGSLHSDDTIKWEDACGSAYTDVGINNIYKSYYNGIVDTKIITTKHGHTIEATNEHKFRIVDDNGKYAWECAENLRVGCHMVLSEKINDNGGLYEFDRDIRHIYDYGCTMCGKIYDKDVLMKMSNIDDGLCASCITSYRMVRDKIGNLPSVLDDDIAELIGILFGDGFFSDNGVFGVSCDRKYPDYIQYIKRLVKKVLNVECRDEISDKDYSVRFNSRAFSLLLVKNNIHKKSSLEITVPSPILASNNNVKCAFLRGLFDTDGSVSCKINAYVSLSSISIKLLNQVQTMLLSLGMRSSIRKFCNSVGRFSKNTQYEVRLMSQRDVDKFEKLIGFSVEYKSNLLKTRKSNYVIKKDNFSNKYVVREFCDASVGLPRKVRSDLLRYNRNTALPRNRVLELSKKFKQLGDTVAGFLAKNDLFTDEIISINNSVCKTYDITVDKSHTYVANGFISHNSVIVISTPNGTAGIGEWYYETWSDAVDGSNDFNPIDIHWWEMDWEINYKDQKSGSHVSISPTRGIRKNTSKDDIRKYGPYWSPWLEEQYRGLTKRGDDKLFRQEVLAEFIGSGSTILPHDVLTYLQTKQDDTYLSINMVKYINPIVGVPTDLDFHGRLWIWEKPIIDLESPAKSHIYVAGVDTATGTGDDYSAVVVFDIITMKQVAEIQIKCIPKIFAYMADYIGRLYNNAMLVVERTGIGHTVVTELNEDLAYPNLYRGKKELASLKKKFIHYGFNTVGTSKQTLQRAILDYITEEDGYEVKSSRLIKELSALVDIGNNKMKGKTGTHDDIALACALALVGIDVYYTNHDRGNMAPVNTDIVKYNSDNLDADFRRYMEVGGKNTLMPVITTATFDITRTASDEIENFARQIGGITVDKNNINIIAKQKHMLNYTRKQK